MQREKILIVDDEPDILDFLRIALEAEHYEVIEAKDGEEALEKVHRKSPHLVILDYMMPKVDGYKVCQILKNDILLRHLPVIILTGKKELADKVEGIDAGADDYIVKPFEPTELLARVKMILRRSSRDLDANPLTKLPGNVSILNELGKRIAEGDLFVACYLDLDKFKVFNDKYGFERGDEVIRETARIILRMVQRLGDGGDFIGHIGGDDFVVITTPKVVDTICSEIIKEFDRTSPNFYNKEDQKRGYIMGKDRKGQPYKVPLLTISIGVVTNEKRNLTHVAQVSEIGAELKAYAKSKERSNYVKERRD